MLGYGMAGQKEGQAFQGWGQACSSNVVRWGVARPGAPVCSGPSWLPCARLLGVLTRGAGQRCNQKCGKTHACGSAAGREGMFSGVPPC